MTVSNNGWLELTLSAQTQIISAPCSTISFVQVYWPSGRQIAFPHSDPPKIALRQTHL